MPDINLDKIDWDKGDGLVPAIVQNSDNGQILMLAYMDRAALGANDQQQKSDLFQPVEKPALDQRRNIRQLA
jgi:phosphoribosyl-ATP pyrophosphohydrolase/phosphoribosyl-AMP cyclohydrolase